MYISNEDTIAAIATPPGYGGIGVVRVSGPKARELLCKLWRGAVPADRFEPRKFYLGEIAACGGGMIDRVMAVLMPAPNTYTGQDVIELSCHGSPIVLEKILSECISAGARGAGPGEFTRRAFLAGKMDLAQAEGVADIIHATSEVAAKHAAEQLAGRLSNTVTEIGDEIANLRAHVEASIDFPEEDIDILQKEGVAERLIAIAERVQKLSSTFSEGRLIREGVRVAIVGRPNVGKSSILNRLAGHERAIVHHEPGTTRDMIEVSVNFGGVAFHLRDTAGLCDSKSDVEGIGVLKTRDEIEGADLVVAVFDGSEPATEDDFRVAREADSKRYIAVVNKVDLKRELNTSFFKDKQLRSINISAKNDVGFDSLKKLIYSATLKETLHEEGCVITSSRHREALDGALKGILAARSIIGLKEPMECVAEHLRIAQEKIGTITGAVTTEDLLDRIFSNFCIGK